MPGFSRTPFDDFMDAKARELDGEWFYGRVAGTIHANDDGSSRQAEIETLKPRDELRLDPDPDNPHDKNAVRVVAPSGVQVGHLESRLAGETVRRLRSGMQSRCFVSNVTGGAGQSRGVVFGLVKFQVG